MPSEKGLAADAAAFYDRLVARPDVDAARVIGHGRSLGGGVIGTLAATRPLAGLVLESTFTSVPDVVPHVPRGVAPQVEVSVLREVHGRGGALHVRFEVHPEAICLAGQAVRHLARQPAREALVSVGAHVRQAHGRGFCVLLPALEPLHLPHRPVEAPRPAVQACAPANVGRDLDLPSAQREGRP